MVIWLTPSTPQLSTLFMYDLKRNLTQWREKIMQITKQNQNGNNNFLDLVSDFEIKQEVFFSQMRPYLTQGC